MKNAKKNISALLIVQILLVAIFTPNTLAVNNFEVNSEAIYYVQENVDSDNTNTLDFDTQNEELEAQLTDELIVLAATDCDIGGWDGGYPGDDGSVAPGEEWIWIGNGPAGSNAGSWTIPGTLYYLWGHFTNNGGGHGPHWDYRDNTGTKYRIYPDGRYELKN